MRARASYELIETRYAQDGTRDAIIWLGAYRADRATHVIRLMQCVVGDHTDRSITNVLDPADLRIQDAARLDARRWDIEMAVNTVKSHRGLQLFMAAKPVVIQQQIWAVLIVAQIFAAFRQESAGRAEVDLFAVSLPLLIEYVPHSAAADTDPSERVIEHGRELGFIRPSSRTTITAPVSALDQYHTRSPDLVLQRLPRYAHRRCDRNAS